MNTKRVSAGLTSIDLGVNKDYLETFQDCILVGFSLENSHKHIKRALKQ